MRRKVILIGLALVLAVGGYFWSQMHARGYS
jgi:hypothetical protein